MTRKELIYELSKQSNLPQADVARLVEGVFKQISLALKQGDKVQIIGFGTFQVRERAKREILNPRTGKPVEVPAHNLPTFTAGNTLKRAVKQKRSELNDNRRSANHDRKFFFR